MAPTDENKAATGNLDRDSLRQIVTRLKEVRRRCAAEPVMPDRRDKAVEGLDAVMADPNRCLEPDSEPMEVEDLDLRLATIEDLFEAMSSQGLARVIANIRSSLSTTPEDPGKEEEPPPPRRFQPSPTSAVRRPRPRPQPRKGRVKVSAPARRGFFGWLKWLMLIGSAVAVASVVYLQQREREIPPAEPPARVVIEEPVVFAMATPSAPKTGPVEWRGKDEFDPGEEDVARFTLEIRLAESSLDEGDIRGSLRHFATAAAIDRHHRRLVDTGKALIAALLQQADLAIDRGDRESAGKTVQSARSIARGLRLDDSAIDRTAKKHETMTRFEDITPQDGEGLQRAVGRPVRLTLKTRDVIFGHLKEIQGDILLIDVYSGVKGGGVEFSTSILRSTINHVRVYDAQGPSEIMTGD